MNPARVSQYQALLNAVFNGEKAIAVFVVNGHHYYVIDEKINYCIDVRPEYQAYVDNNLMDASLYQQAVSSFRNGLPVLTKDNFHEYIANNNLLTYSSAWMRQLFLFEKNMTDIKEFYSYIERFLSYSSETVSSEWDAMRMRLPAFYINFDKRIFRHTDWDREHELLVPADWHAKADIDFGLFIPDSEQYWLIDNMNFWKLYA